MAKEVVDVRETDQSIEAGGSHFNFRNVSKFTKLTVIYSNFIGTI